MLTAGLIVVLVTSIIISTVADNFRPTGTYITNHTNTVAHTSNTVAHTSKAVAHTGKTVAHTYKAVVHDSESHANVWKDYLRQITHENRGDFIFEHNVVRSATEPTATNMVYMVWAQRLEKLADIAVSDCTYKDSLNDNERKELGLWFSSGGLNSWFGRAKDSLNVSEIVRSWSLERQYFDYANLGCELGRRCIHYAQIVWATTSHVGCSMKYCRKFIDQALNQLNNIHYVVCMYGEGGTKIDHQGDYKFPYKSGNASCEDCPTGFSGCRDGLCDTEPPCETVVDCKKMGIIEFCLCDESVYVSGQRSIVALWTQMEAVAISTILFYFYIW